LIITTQKIYLDILFNQTLIPNIFQGKFINLLGSNFSMTYFEGILLFLAFYLMFTHNI